MALGLQMHIAQTMCAAAPSLINSLLLVPQVVGAFRYCLKIHANRHCPSCGKPVVRIHIRTHGSSLGLSSSGHFFGYLPAHNAALP